MANKNKIPYVINAEAYIAAGIDPATGLPLKIASSDPSQLKSNIRKELRINDLQVAVNKFKWFNLPSGLDGKLIEKILYYRGTGAFFYMEPLKKFFFLPYGTTGSPDVYGRPTGIIPLTFGGTTGDTEKDMKPWIKDMIKKPVYDIQLTDMTYADFTDSAFILDDYTKQLSQKIIPRQMLSESIIDVESDCLPFLRTALLNSTGVLGMKVGSGAEATSVEEASKYVTQAALTGQKYIPIVGSIDFQELAGSTVAQAEEFLMSMQAIDNFRLGTHGLENGGLFQKKAHELMAEQQMNSGSVGPVLQDGLSNRQAFCDKINSFYGLEMWCDVDETVGIDRNGDGQIVSEMDQSGTMPGDQPQEVIDNADVD